MLSGGQASRLNVALASRSALWWVPAERVSIRDLRLVALPVRIDGVTMAHRNRPVDRLNDHGDSRATCDTRGVGPGARIVPPHRGSPSQSPPPVGPSGSLFHRIDGGSEARRLDRVKRLEVVGGHPGRHLDRTSDSPASSREESRRAPACRDPGLALWDARAVCVHTSSSHPGPRLRTNWRGERICSATLSWSRPSASPSARHRPTPPPTPSVS